MSGEVGDARKRLTASPSLDLEARFEEALAAHEFYSGNGWAKPSCSCGEWATGERFYEEIHAAHRAHVNSVLAALVPDNGLAAKVAAVLDRYVQMDTDPEDIEPEDSWRLIRDLRALLDAVDAALATQPDTTEEES